MARSMFHSGFVGRQVSAGAAQPLSVRPTFGAPSHQAGAPVPVQAARPAPAAGPGKASCPVCHKPPGS